MSSPRAVEPSKYENSPPDVSLVAVFALTLASAGIFLYVWILLWANYIRTANPNSRVGPLSWVNVVPGALFYINLPSLVMAMHVNDTTEISRLHIAMVLWGSVALVSLIATGISIFVAQRQIGIPTRHKP